MPFKKERQLMRRLNLIYLAIFLLSLFLLSLFLVHDQAVRKLDKQLQTLHYARQDFDAGVLHVLLADDSLVQWKKELGQQRFEQTIAGLLDIASKHDTSKNTLQEEIIKVKQNLEHFLSLKYSSKIELSEYIIDLRLKIEQLHSVLSSELELTYKNGRYWFFGTVFSALILVIGLFITLLKTEKKRECIRRELYSSEHRLSLIADNIDEIFWLQDMQSGKILYVSSAFEKLWQLSPDAFYQSADIWMTKIHPDDIALVKSQLANPLIQNTQLEYRIILGNNETHWINERLFPIKSLDENGELKHLVVAVLSDITATKKLNEQLMMAQKMESLGKLTSGIAHDFNNLLTVIVGNAQLIKELLPNDPQISDIAALIVKATERGASLNRQLLAFASKQQLKPEQIDIRDMLADMQQLLRRTLGESIRIEYQPCSDDICSFVDEGQLQNAIINLCINAKDAMPSGGCITISLSRTVDNHFAILEIADSGDGIDEATIPHIFEPFFTTKSNQKGSGLGLSMVYGFAKQSGGDIQVESQYGQGTKFSLSLPLCCDKSLKPDSTISQQTVNMKPKMLLVEDDVMVRDTVLQMLGSENYTIIVAENADNALLLLKEHTDISLLLTDIIMPGKLNGIALADYVRQHFPHIEIILTSGYVGNLNKQYSSFSSYSFLPKPFSKTELTTALGKLVHDY